MKSLLSRRSLLQLSTGAVFASGGCLDFQEPFPDLSIYSRIDESITVSITVTRGSDDRELLADTVTIPKEESHKYDNPITEPGTHLIQVSVEEGAENTYEWDAPEDEDTGLHIRINPEGIEFVQVIA